MSDLNMVALSGRLTHDLNERSFAETRGGAAVLRFTIAVNGAKRGAAGNWEDDPAFIEIECWGAAAERMRSRLRKGQEVVVGGSLRQERWRDRDGNHRERIKAVARWIRERPLAPQPPAGEGWGGGEAAAGPQEGEGGEWGEDDLPF